MNDQDEYEQLLRLLAGKSQVTMFIGTYVTTDTVTITTDAGGGRFPAKSATPYRPQVGESVWVAFIDQVPFMLGPTTTKPGTGTVVSVASNLATISTDIGQVLASFNSGLTLSAGQIVKLFWNDGPHVIGVMSAPLPVPTAPNQPNPANPVSHTDTFTALDSGSWTDASGWWSQQVLADAADLGAWFYGTKISDTLNGASVSRIEMYVSLDVQSGASPNLAYHAYSSKPATSPVLTGALATDVSDGAWVSLPLAFGAFLASNPGGIGVAHGGASKFRSLSEDAQSGALRITSTY